MTAPVPDGALKCPACKHLRHRETCKVRLPWWRRLFGSLLRGGLTVCSCEYYDARWDK